MNNEVDILLSIYNDLIINIEHIKNSKLKNTKIKNSINLLNNNFFLVNCNDELFNHYLNMFDDNDVYYELLKNLESLKTQTEYHIKNRCQHEWVNDLIDIDPDRAQQICYCVKCELTKK
jgi:hypothetical protein